jgi:hypothetical protein
LSAAQSPATIPTPVATTEVPGDAQAIQERLDEAIEASESEVAVLQAQLQEMKAANSTMLTIVQWTVGVVVAALVVLLGYNVVQQRWADDRTRKNITEDIRTELRQYVEEERDSLKSQLSEVLLAEVEESLEAMKAELNSLSATSEQTFSALRRDYGLMKLQLLEESVRRSLQYGPFVSVHEALQLLELSLELEAEGPLLDRHVTGALESLRAILPKAFWITEGDINQIGAALDKVPDKYATSRETIRAEVKVRGPEPPPIPEPPSLPRTAPQSRILNAPASSPPKTQIPRRT